MTQMLNVLLIGPEPQAKGGIATVIRGMLDSDDLTKFVNLKMWPSYKNGPVIYRALYSGMRELAFRCSKRDYGIYHIHTASGTSFWRKCAYVQALRGDANKAVLHVHGGKFVDFWDGCSLSQRNLIKETFAKVGRVIALSSESANMLIARGIAHEEKISILANAVEIPERSKIDYSSNRVLFMGHLNENKSPDVLIRAAAIVLESHPDVHFVFAGDGNIKQYKALAEELEIADSCEFPGWVSGDVRSNLLSSSSIYCLPSKKEAMPMGLLEAMSFGLAVVATRQGYIPSVIKDGENGRLIEVDDYRGLARILDSLIANVDLKQRIGRMARCCVQNAFGMASYANRLNAIYEEVAQ